MGTKPPQFNQTPTSAGMLLNEDGFKAEINGNTYSGETYSEEPSPVIDMQEDEPATTERDETPAPASTPFGGFNPFAGFNPANRPSISSMIEANISAKPAQSAAPQFALAEAQESNASDSESSFEAAPAPPPSPSKPKGMSLSQMIESQMANTFDFAKRGQSASISQMVEREMFQMLEARGVQLPELTSSPSLEEMAKESVQDALAMGREDLANRLRDQSTVINTLESELERERRANAGEGVIANTEAKLFRAEEAEIKDELYLAKQMLADARNTSIQAFPYATADAIEAQAKLTQVARTQEELARKIDLLEKEARAASDLAAQYERRAADAEALAAQEAEGRRAAEEAARRAAEEGSKVIEVIKEVPVVVDDGKPKPLFAFGTTSTTLGSTTIDIPTMPLVAGGATLAALAFYANLKNNVVDASKEDKLQQKLSQTEQALQKERELRTSMAVKNDQLYKNLEEFKCVSFLLHSFFPVLFAFRFFCFKLSSLVAQYPALFLISPLRFFQGQPRGPRHGGASPRPAQDRRAAEHHRRLWPPGLRHGACHADAAVAHGGAAGPRAPPGRGGAAVRRRQHERHGAGAGDGARRDPLDERPHQHADREPHDLGAEPGGRDGEEGREPRRSGRHGPRDRGPEGRAVAAARGAGRRAPHAGVTAGAGRLRRLQLGLRRAVRCYCFFLLLLFAWARLLASCGLVSCPCRVSSRIGSSCAPLPLPRSRSRPTPSPSLLLFTSPLQINAFNPPQIMANLKIKVAERAREEVERGLSNMGSEVVEQLQRDMFELQQAVGKFRDESARLSRELETSRVETTKMSRELAAAREESKVLQAKVQFLSTSLNKAEANLALERETKAETRAENAELQRKVAELKNELARMAPQVTFSPPSLGSNGSNGGGANGSASSYNGGGGSSYSSGSNGGSASSYASAPAAKSPSRSGFGSSFAKSYQAAPASYSPPSPAPVASYEASSSYESNGNGNGNGNGSNGYDYGSAGTANANSTRVDIRNFEDKLTGKIVDSLKADIIARAREGLQRELMEQGNTGNNNNNNWN